MFVWLHGHRTETIKAATPRASRRSGAVLIRRAGHPRGPAPRLRLTHSLVTLTVRWTVPRGPVHLSKARRDLVRQSRASGKSSGMATISAKAIPAPEAQRVR